MADEDADNPRDVEAFNRMAADIVAMDEVRTALGHFLAEFASFETIQLSAVLKAVSHDVTIVEYLPELMDLRNRLKLLKYITDTQGLPEALASDVTEFRKSADALREWRNEFAHGGVILSKPFLTDPESTDVVGGVMRPRSKWRIPKQVDEKTNFLTVTREWLHASPRIRECTQLVIRLGNASAQLAAKLEAYRRAEPWEQMLVPVVAIPKRPE